MTGLYIHPDVMSMDVPGQVPRLDPDIDAPAFAPDGRLTITAGATPSFDFDVDEPVLSEAVMVQNLGLEPSVASFVRALVMRELGAPNEIVFRQSMMTTMIEQRFPPTLRRAILARAVRVYRNSLPPRLVVKSEQPGQPDGAAEIEAQVRELLDDGGDIGIPTKALVDVIRRHGSPAVVSVLKRIGAQHHAGRVFISKSHDLDDTSAEATADPRAHTREMSSYVIKAEPEVLPRGAHAAGGGDDPRADPPGARKIWNKRIVEKQPDGKWHVVGHVAGLEDPKAVTPLDTSVLTREHLLHLLRQLIRVHQAENGKPDPKSAKAKEK